MSGHLLAAGGEVCPGVMSAPFELGKDIVGNAVCCANYTNPPSQTHVCRFLPGQVPEVCRTCCCYCSELVTLCKDHLKWMPKL